MHRKIPSDLASGPSLDDTATNTTSEDIMNSSQHESEESARETLKRHMSLSASVDPFDEEHVPFAPAGGGTHYGRVHRRSRSQNLQEIVTHFKVGEDNSMLLYHGEGLENSFDFGDFDATKSPMRSKAGSGSDSFPSSSAEMLTNAGMRPLVLPDPPDLETETDGAASSSSPGAANAGPVTMPPPSAVQRPAATPQHGQPTELPDDLKLSPPVHSRTRFNKQSAPGVAFGDIKAGGGGGLYGSVFESDSASVSMSIDHGDAAAANRLHMLSSMDWQDFTVLQQNRAGSPVKSPRGDDVVESQPASKVMKIEKPGSLQRGPSPVLPSIPVSPSDSNVSDLVYPVKVLSIQQHREHAVLDKDNSPAVRIGAHFASEAPPASPADPFTGYIKQLSASGMPGKMFAQSGVGQAAAAARISDTVYHGQPRNRYDSQDVHDGSGGSKSRGKYKCGRCGAPKVNHVCEFMEGSSVATQVELVNGFAVNVSLDGPDKVLVVGKRATRPSTAAVAPVTAQSDDLIAAMPPAASNSRNAVHYVSTETLTNLKNGRPPVVSGGGRPMDPPTDTRSRHPPTQDSHVVPEGMISVMTPSPSSRYLSSRTGSAELPPLFSAALGSSSMVGIRETPSMDVADKGKSMNINFAHSFDILDLPSYDPSGMVSLSQDEFDDI